MVKSKYKVKIKIEVSSQFIANSVKFLIERSIENSGVGKIKSIEIESIVDKSK